MKVTISTELNEKSRIPQWLVDAVHHAERSGVRLVITTGTTWTRTDTKIERLRTRPRKPVKA